MQGVFIVVLLAASAAAIPESLCPKIQELDWEIEVLLPHRDCNKFYQCTHGKPIEMLCPKSLLYNIVEKQCDWKDRVDCGNRIIPEEKETVVTPGPGVVDSIHTGKPHFPIMDFLPNGCPVDPDIHWLLPHEENCRLFYNCDRGKRELIHCPLGLHFNKKHQICDWPQNVGCIELKEKYIHDIFEKKLSIA